MAGFWTYWSHAGEPADMDVRTQMKLSVCYGTFPTPRPGGHRCKNAYDALRDAGYQPPVVRTYGLGPSPAS
jgi:hypothetical protein